MPGRPDDLARDAVLVQVQPVVDKDVGLNSGYNWAAAAAAFDKFLADVPGGTLTEKDEQWKQARPDYARLIAVSPAKANALSGLELVREAVYWKATTLLKAGHARDAKALADDLTTRFPGLRIADKVAELKTACNAAIGEGK